MEKADKRRALQTFAKVIRERFGDHVRLSIHPSSGKEKLYIPLIPQDSFTMTPWHATVVADVRGNFRTVHVEKVRDSHVLVYQDGKPSFFRERSPLFEWEAEVEFKNQYGRELLISKRGSGSAILTASDKEKLASLVMSHRTIEVRGFESAKTC